MAPGSTANPHVEDELAEIWDDGDGEDQSAASHAVVGIDHLPQHGGLARHASGSAGQLHSHLATISEPEDVERGDEHDSAGAGGGSSSSGVESDEEAAARHALRLRSEGAVMSSSLSGGYLASLNNGPGSSAPSPAPFTMPSQRGASLSIPLSMPARPGSPSSSSMVQLGTSAPINIPMSASRRLPGLDGADERKQHASTFVPPHLMEMQQRDADGEAAGLGGSALTLTGVVSPSTSLRRDRLVQRNAILRSTGFLEASAGFARNSGFVETLDPIKEGLAAAAAAAASSSPSGAPPMERPGVGASALSKALGDAAAF